MQASYVDQPVLTPLLAWVSLKLFGVSLTGLRLWPALVAGATVVISGLTGHNTEWWWGPGNPRTTTMVVVAGFAAGHNGGVRRPSGAA